MTAADTMLSQGFAELRDQHPVKLCMKGETTTFTGIIGEPFGGQGIGADPGLSSNGETLLEITVARDEFGAVLPNNGDIIQRHGTRQTFQIVRPFHEPGSHIVVFLVVQPASP